MVRHEDEKRLSMTDAAPATRPPSRTGGSRAGGARDRVGHRRGEQAQQPFHRPPPLPEDVAARGLVVTVDGWRLGLAICYEAAVPQHAADTAALGIDAYVASTLYGSGPGVEARRDAHMRERAAAHGSWVILATAAGPSGSFAETSGGSGIWGRSGELVAQASRNADEMTTARLC
ncbi:nitrilase-related carbon-nitrogen hydrolase [Streptomyces sp. NPDC006463]|uniref:nitrilase-related carbon-nitrogen hydrolase n=1 Tax=Streptomyces sp. NPDC006463 TaxID=3364746 RepID=UPI0036C2678F